MAHARDRGTVTPRVILDMRKSLWVRCMDGQHDASVDIVSLIDRGWADWPISQFRFRCQECGGSNANPRLDREA